MIVFKHIFSGSNKETMNNAKKHKVISKNGAFNNNIFCAIVVGI